MPPGGQSKKSAERDSEGKEFLSDQPWQKMDVSTIDRLRNGASSLLSSANKRVFGEITPEEKLRVIWLSGTLFFIVGGYWLLRSLKDPIIATMVGVDRIPQAKICSLFVVLGLVLLYNKLVDLVPKHYLFYIIGGFYACLFAIIAALLAHPTIGIANTTPDPTRWIGWISYFAIESFGSMVIQLFWAFVNASVDLGFAKRNFGTIVAGAQIGSILGPTLATQATFIGVPTLYGCGAVCMGMMVVMVYLYVQKFGALAEQEEPKADDKNKKKGGLLEGFYLFWEHDYIKGIFALSCMFMIAVTILDYTMKFLAKARFDELYPEDHDMATNAFAAFMGLFGQITNGISFLFSLFGTSFVIQRFGLAKTLLAFPTIVTICVLAVYFFPNLWMVFSVMMVIKGMSYALNNPCKELLYQPTSSSVKFKCKSWIDTFGARGSKALGSVVTNAFANSMSGLLTYGTLVSLLVTTFLIWVARFMGQKFNEYTETNYKVGEATVYDQMVELGQVQGETDDTSCGLEEEGQADDEEAAAGAESNGAKNA